MLMSESNSKRVSDYSDIELSAIIDHIWENRKDIFIKIGNRTTPFIRERYRDLGIFLDDKIAIIIYRHERKNISSVNLDRLDKLEKWYLRKWTS